MTNATAGVVLAGAGSGVRFGGDKVFAALCGQPVLAHSVGVFEHCSLIGSIVIVLGQESLEQGKALVAQQGWRKVVAVCAGGSRRQDSVREGLARLSECQWVIVHDAARPLVTAAMVEAGLAAAQGTGAAIAAMPAKDTIKIVHESGLVEDTLDRSLVWLAQTPQVFQRDLLVAAHHYAGQDATDDALMVERLGHRVAVFRGAYENIKITTKEDLAIAECLLGLRE